MSFYDLLDLPYLETRQPKILRQFDLRLQPEFRLTVAAVDVDMRPRFFTGKEKKPIAFFPKDRWTHRNNITQNANDA
jgi:hypothetical protein